MKGRIKIGAKISQDFGFGKWPTCKPPRGSREEGIADDPNMVFEVEWINETPGYWNCVADGFGAMPSNGVVGTYGNGSIYVSDKGGIDFDCLKLPPEYRYPTLACYWPETPPMFDPYGWIRTFVEHIFHTAREIK